MPIRRTTASLLMATVLGFGIGPLSAAPSAVADTCTQGTFRVHPTDNRYFQVCNDGQWVDYHCPPGTLAYAFDDTVICDYPR